jgi:DNA polymerase (family X)
MDNHAIAQRLLDYANVLEADEDNLFRARAYRRAAETVLRLDEPISDLLARAGRAGLEALPGIGSHLSFTIDSLVRTGELRTVRGAGGHVDPRRLFSTLPGVGPFLARTIHEDLGIRTLEDLEVATHDGRLARAGVGPKRLRGISDALAIRLARSRLSEPVQGEPPVAALLAIDQEYQDRADTDLLPTVAPRRFNPENEPWLPLYQADREGWRFRAMFSNTALAHRLGQTRDWVVIAFSDSISAGKRTIVTETRGDLRGRRVVRGRELECRDYYEARVSA